MPYSDLCGWSLLDLINCENEILSDCRDFSFLSMLRHLTRSIPDLEIVHWIRILIYISNEMGRSCLTNSHTYAENDRSLNESIILANWEANFERLQIESRFSIWEHLSLSFSLSLPSRLEVQVEVEQFWSALLRFILWTSCYELHNMNFRTSWGS